MFDLVARDVEGGPRGGPTRLVQLDQLESYSLVLFFFFFQKLSPKVVPAQYHHSGHRTNKLTTPIAESIPLRFNRPHKPKHRNQQDALLMPITRDRMLDLLADAETAAQAFEDLRQEVIIACNENIHSPEVQRIHSIIALRFPGLSLQALYREQSRLRTNAAHAEREKLRMRRKREMERQGQGRNARGEITEDQLIAEVRERVLGVKPQAEPSCPKGLFCHLGKCTDFTSCEAAEECLYMDAATVEKMKADEARAAAAMAQALATGGALPGADRLAASNAREAELTRGISELFEEGTSP